MVCADEIRDLPWRVPTRDGAVEELLRDGIDARRLPDLLERYPALALPEVAAEVDCAVVRQTDGLQRTHAVPSVLGYLRQLEASQPEQYAILVWRCADYLQAQHVRSMRASMHIIELCEQAKRLLFSQRRVAEPQPVSAPGEVVKEFVAGQPVDGPTALELERMTDDGAW